MRHKFLKDLGIDIDDETKDMLNQFDLNGFMDQISDNRLKEENEKVEELKEEIKEKKDESKKANN